MLYSKEEFLQKYKNKLDQLKTEIAQLQEAISKVVSTENCKVYVFDDPDVEDQYINYKIFKQ